MICPFCQKTFTEQDSQKVCGHCSLTGGCKKVKCPYCGYETPVETGLVKALRRWKEKRNERSKS